MKPMPWNPEAKIMKTTTTHTKHPWMSNLVECPHCGAPAGSPCHEECDGGEPEEERGFRAVTHFRDITTTKSERDVILRAIEREFAMMIKSDSLTVRWGNCDVLIISVLCDDRDAGFEAGRRIRAFAEGMLAGLRL